MKHLSRSRWMIGCILCLGALTAEALELPVNAADTRFTEPAATTPSPVLKTKQETAVIVARMLVDPAFSSSLAEEFDKTPKEREKSALLNSVLSRYQRKQARQAVSTNASLNARSIQDLQQYDEALREYKGIDKVSSGLLQLRLYQPMGRMVTQAELSQVLVAFKPAGDDKQWSVVQAYDSQGNVYRLDARRAPSFPVLVVDLDAKEDLRAGLSVANQLLAEHGLQTAVQSSRQTPSAARCEDGIETAKLDSIHLKDDQEPWISGAAEVYALVSGVQAGQAKAQIELVEMPYLYYDNEPYKPNQILIFWNNYRYGAANVLLYEHDDNTNYKELALALISGVEKILGVFKPEYTMIAAVARAILQAMPSSWFANDDDYLDSFYTLEKNRRYVDQKGVANNATITLTPYRLTNGS